MENQSDKEVAYHYIKTFSDTAREPFLILDENLVVIGANESFYRNFSVTKDNTEHKLVYELGNGQWNIPELRELLEKILPEKKFSMTMRLPMNFLPSAQR